MLNVLASVTPPWLQWLMQFLYTGGEVSVAPATISVLYSIVPWVGVMAAGYAFGAGCCASRRSGIGGSGVLVLP